MTKPVRVTLTKKQAESAYGQQLIHHILAMSHDGDLSIDEVRSLHILLRSGPKDMEAVKYLRSVTTTVLHDEHVDEHEAYQLRTAMERVVPKNVRLVLSELLSSIGLPHDVLDDIETEDFRSSNRRWRSDPITAKQYEYIKNLGGAPRSSMTKGQASELIDELLQRRPPSPRQQMAIRFFGCMELMSCTKEEVGVWLDSLYAQHEAYEHAWHKFKLDIGDDGTIQDPLIVPIGAYKKYVRMHSRGPKTLTIVLLFLSFIIILIIVVSAVFTGS